ncbi:hypothetical protein BC567DRAFT_233804 [Phyllosticta citribraziliensis]
MCFACLHQFICRCSSPCLAVPFDRHGRPGACSHAKSSRARDSLPRPHEVPGPAKTTCPLSAAANMHVMPLSRNSSLHLVLRKRKEKQQPPKIWLPLTSSCQNTRASLAAYALSR